MTATETKECAQCSRVFPRKANWSQAQWDETCYCSKSCSSKAAAGRPFLSTLFSKVNVDPVTRCWLWSAAKDTKGYGLIRHDGKNNQKVHRVVYQLAVASIPEGMIVCHRCDTPACCNPFHLFLGSTLDNMADMKLKGRANYARGEAAGNSRLTESEAIAIRNDPRPQEIIAAQYGIAQTTVSAIKTRRNWSHVE